MGRGRFLCFLLFLSALAWSGWAQAPPGDAVAEYEYYPDGLTRTIRYANGVVSAFDYFDNGRLRSVDTRAADGALVSRYEYDYDADGRRVEMREWNATPARRAADPLWAAAPAVTRYGHDNLGRLAWAEYRSAEPGAPYRRVEYACDAAGNRLGETAREHAPDGAVRRTLKDRRFVIDNRNRLAAVIDALAPERSVRYLANAAGDTVARITGVMGPDGEIVPGTERHRLLFDWDAAGRLRRVRQATPGPDGAPVEELLAEFRYDYRGRRVAAHSRFVALGGDAVPAESRLYVYDGDAVLAEYGFDADGRTPYRARQYVYGRDLLAMETYAPPGAGMGTAPPSSALTGTAAGWPSPTGPPARAGVPGAGPNPSATHPTLPDPASPRIITEADRFASRAGSSPWSAAPAYPTPGSSPAGTPPVSTGSHLPSPISPLPSPASRLSSPVSPLPSPAGVYFYHLDALGSTVNLTAADGAVAEAYLYDAWGNYRELDVPAADVPAGWTWVVDPDLDANGLYCWATYQACLQGAFTADDAAAPDLNRITYTGHAFDPATGLYHFQARFYDPEAGRFLSADPYLGDPATPPSLHRFLYAYSNPLRYVDPTGYQSESAEEIARRKQRSDQALARLADLTGSSAAGDVAAGLPAAAGRALFKPEVYRQAVEELVAEMETAVRHPGALVHGAVTGALTGPEQLGDWIREQLPLYRDTLIRWDRMSAADRSRFVQDLADQGLVNITKAGLVVSLTHQARIVVEANGRILRNQTSSVGVRETSSIIEERIPGNTRPSNQFDGEFPKSIETKITGELSLKLSTEAKGKLGEAWSRHTILRAGYQELPARLPRNQGFDGVFIKYSHDGSISDIIVAESKFSASGKASLAKTVTKGKQLSEQWMRSTIDQMIESTDPNVQNTGRLLKNNFELIRTKANVLNSSGINRWNKIKIPDKQP